MSINLTDEIEVKTKKGKLGAAKQIFLEGDTQTVEKEIQDINSRHNTLNTKHESLSRTVQGITVTGGASTANNVTYNNDISGLNAENAQDAIDELASKKFDKANIVNESGTDGYKVMSQYITTRLLDGKATKDDISTINIELNKKFDKVNIAHETGFDAEKVMSQYITTRLLNNKFDKANIVDTTGEAYDKVMSQIATSTELNKKATKDDISSLDKKVLSFNRVQNNINFPSIYDYTFGDEFTEPVLIEGKILRTDGSMADLQNFTTTDKIEVPSSTYDVFYVYVKKLQQTDTFNASIVFYDKDDNAVSYVQRTLNDDVLIPLVPNEFYSYIRIGYQTGFGTTIRIYDRKNIHKINIVNLLNNVNNLHEIIHNKWFGKKILCIGDSITALGTWVNIFKSIVKPSIIYNRGVSGTTIAGTSPNTFCNRAELPKDDAENNPYVGFPTSADLIIVYGGVNDWGAEGAVKDFGDINGEVNKTSYCGAIKYLFKKLKSDYPNSRIVTIINYNVYGGTTLFNNFREINYTDDDETKSFTFVEHNGKTGNDYRNAMIEIAKQYGIPSIDLRNVGFSFWNMQDREKYSYYQSEQYDGLHPSENGATLIANYIATQVHNI